jgi:hypothetical protein
MCERERKRGEKGTFLIGERKKKKKKKMCNEYKSVGVFV